MEDNLERQVHDLERRLQHIEQQVRDARTEEQRKRRQAVWARIGLLVFVGIVYAWYLFKVTSIL